MNENAFLVKLNSKDNLEYLESIGYDNIQNITFDNLRIKVVVIDDSKNIIMPISVTCLAALKIKPLDFEKFRMTHESNVFDCDNLEC